MLKSIINLLSAVTFKEIIFLLNLKVYFRTHTHEMTSDQWWGTCGRRANAGTWTFDMTRNWISDAQVTTQCSVKTKRN